jgi:hypothetical protein
MRRHSLRLVLLAALALPVAARADDGDRRDGDVRVERSCGAGSSIRVRVRPRGEDTLRVELEVRTARRGAPWSVVVVHERRLALEATRRTSAASGSFAIRLTIPDWPGRDSVVVRATGPRGEACRATATVAEP